MNKYIISAVLVKSDEEDESHVIHNPIGLVKADNQILALQQFLLELPEDCNYDDYKIEHIEVKEITKSEK